ncbi:hypothetical protein DIPPA_21026 [Diplonema papillatum]|nr:hypothetical protein DIPPA_21026 [Diplonema papillatum]
MTGRWRQKPWRVACGFMEEVCPTGKPLRFDLRTARVSCSRADVVFTVASSDQLISRTFSCELPRETALWVERLQAASGRQPSANDGNARLDEQLASQLAAIVHAEEPVAWEP